MGGSVSTEKNDDARVRMIMQMQREAQIIIGDQTCRADVMNSVAEINPDELVDSLDQFVVKERLTYKYYDPEFMRALSCVLKLGLTTDPQLNASRLVDSFFTGRRQIGAPSVEGVALMTGQQGLKDMFIIKAPKNPMVDNLVHEYFVAAGGTVPDGQGNMVSVVGTNWLRKQCLNYAQVIGAFRCGPPDVDPLSKKVRKWCSIGNKEAYVNYVIYEKINGPELSTLAPTMSTRSFVSTIIQLTYALQIGQMYNGFTHYDLHHENVLSRVANNGDVAMIPFILTEDLTVYIKDTHVPTIIDYGRSHIQSPAPGQGEAVHFGYHSNLTQYGLYPDRARPFYDLYKIIGFLLYGMAIKDNPAFNEAWKIMGFFGFKSQEQVIAWLAEGRKPSNLFSLTDDLGSKLCMARQGEGSVCIPEDNITINDFLAYVERQFPNYWRDIVYAYPVQGVKVLQCGAQCDTFGAALEDITMDTSNIPLSKLSTFESVEDLMTYRNNLQQRAKYFTERFPQSRYGDALSKEVASVDAMLIGQYETLAQRGEQDLIKTSQEAQAAFKEIGYPYKFTGEQSPDPRQNASDLVRAKSYLERMGVYARKHAKFKAVYEAVEDLVRIRGIPMPAVMTEFMEKQMNPMYQAYDNSKGELRRIVQNTTNLPPGWERAKSDIVALTL